MIAQGRRVGKQSDRNILASAALPILSKAYYESHDFLETTQVPPLGSGPYKVKELNQGSFITYELRNDWWAKDLKRWRYRYNYDRLILQSVR